MKIGKYKIELIINQDFKMPKYIPTFDDMWNTKLCFVCGRDVLDENSETCSDWCRQQKEQFDEDWSWFLWKEYEDFPDE